MMMCRNMQYQARELSHSPVNRQDKKYGVALVFLLSRTFRKGKIASKKKDRTGDDAQQLEKRLPKAIVHVLSRYAM